jgi:hypothetical protein
LTVPDPGLAQARDVARRLVGAGAEVRHVVGGGRNSRIYHVRQCDREFALKQYPSRRDDPRDRLSTEVGALRLMEQHQVEAVPRVVGVDSERNYALLSWIEGTEVATVDDTDIDAAVAFLGAVHALRHVPGASAQPRAAEACLSGSEIARQIADRVTKLRALCADEPGLRDFLEGAFAPALARRLAAAQAATRAAAIDFAGEVPLEWRSLVPSDFGFHNSLRRPDGSLAFIDFEYFGWDDPVKLTADILLHPGRPLAAQHRRRFREAVVRHYGQGGHFESRLAAYLPLFGLRWVLILLNEFMPERWRRRQLAGAGGSWSEAKARQLDSALRFLAELDQKVED